MQIEKQFNEREKTYLYQPIMSTNIQILEKNGHRFNCKQLHPSSQVQVILVLTPKMKAASRSVFVLDL